MKRRVCTCSTCSSTLRLITARLGASMNNHTHHNKFLDQVYNVCSWEVACLVCADVHLCKHIFHAYTLLTNGVRKVFLPYHTSTILYSVAKKSD